MTIDVEISAEHVNTAKIKGKTVVVIDVLRATSVMATALANGAKKIIPVKTAEEVFRIAEKYEKPVKAGERHADKVPGFDAGNSPFEFNNESIQGKVIIMSTTNGTNALLKTTDAQEVIIGSFINLEAVVNYLDQNTNDIVILCSGTNGEFSLDDALCAGAVINKLMTQKDYVLTDIATAHLHLFKAEPDLHKALAECKHYKILKKKGLQKDLDYCLSLDVLNIVPVWINGEVRI
ncbi:2-phosphosulfolactate phosphatase [Saccharicrinis sp. FJH2]|uniref:2-phosphosulfolactate phosphatase n=1 Tax=Saccharicrinis sp. FJH65 TaxID=3344659 RepID=UPI0035F400B5